MSVEFIRKADPYVFLSKIEPDATKKREILEHQAGIHLLQEAMSLIELSFFDYIIMYTEYGKPYFVKKMNHRIFGCRISVYHIARDMLPAQFLKEK